MGSGRWDDDSYRAYSTKTSYTTQTRAEVFKNTRLPASLDPSKITLRESCDSPDNPSSVPIILGLDVTGSMGVYAEKIAKEYLPHLMTSIIERSPVRDPHMMFMGIGDVRASDSAPLQVSQFEADIRILESLRELYLEGGGGGNHNESYDLAWYFAANKTKLDNFDKRGEKGFIFTFGDECPPTEALTASEINKIFHSRDMPVYDSLDAQLAAAQEKFHVFHIVIEQGSFYRQSGKKVRETWKELMGSKVLFLADVNDLTDLVISTIRIASGENPTTVISEAKNPEALQYAYNSK
jgi:hypothetical protein